MKKTAFIPIISSLLLSSCNYDFTDYDYQKAVTIKLNDCVSYRYFPSELKIGVDMEKGIVVGEWSYTASSLDETIDINIKTSYIVKNIEMLSYTLVDDDNHAYGQPTNIDPIKKNFKFDLKNISDKLEEYKATYYDYPCVSFYLRVNYIDKTFGTYKFYIDFEDVKEYVA